MSVDHRRLDVAVAQELLYGSNVIAALELVSGEGMGERVACGPLGQSCLHNRVSDGFLNQ